MDAPELELVEYDGRYREAAQSLLTELEEYIVSIDGDHLDVVGQGYREGMLAHDLGEIERCGGACFLALARGEPVGLIMGVLRQYDEADRLDYTCPRAGVVTELVVAGPFRGRGVGRALMQRLESFFRQQGCEYAFVDAFAYNAPALDFYRREGYHPRMVTELKKL